MACKRKKQRAAKDHPLHARNQRHVNWMFGDIIYIMCWLFYGVLILAGVFVVLPLLIWVYLMIAGLM